MQKISLPDKKNLPESDQEDYRALLQTGTKVS